jgi:hypothetical protein
MSFHPVDTRLNVVEGYTVRFGFEDARPVADDPYFGLGR